MMSKESQIISSIYDAIGHCLIGLFFIMLIAVSTSAVTTGLSVFGGLFIILYFRAVVEFLSRCALEDPKADFYKKCCKVHSYGGYLFCASALSSELTVLTLQGFFST